MSYYVKKDDLIKRLLALTGRTQLDLESETVENLSPIYERYVSAAERKYIDVPYKYKDLAKRLGARYDGEKKKMVYSSWRR